MDTEPVRRLQASGDWWGEAEWWRCQALREPGGLAPVNNRANALWLHGDLRQALPEAQRAVQLAPGHPLSWRCLGNVLLDLGRFELAAEAYERSLTLREDAATAFNCSKALLGLGRFDQAYRMAERRHENAAAHWAHWPTAQQVHVWGEQGLGDVIQHLRWLVPLLQRGVAVDLTVEAPLVGLAANGLAWVGGCLRVWSSEARPDRPACDLPASGCAGPLLGLPLKLGFAPLAERSPYLRLPVPGPVLPEGRRPRIGLVWGSGAFLNGGLLEREYRWKTLRGDPLRSLLNALALRPVDLVALQFGADAEPPPWIGSFSQRLPADADFQTTAAWMLGLDLVISVDTAAAHLAGALGVPVWTLLPWAAASRWQRGRRDTPWYASMRLVRQPRQDDWYGLIQRVLAQLDLWLSAWPTPAGLGTAAHSGPGPAAG